MSGGRSGAHRRPERGLPRVAAGDPRSSELPDFRTLGDGLHPPILLEAMEDAGNGFRCWNEQVEHTGYCCQPIRIRGKVEQVGWATGEVRGVYSTTGNRTTCCSSPAGAVSLAGAGPAGHPGDGPGELTYEALAAYAAKYVVKGSEPRLAPETNR